MAQNPFFKLMIEINKSIAHMKYGTNCVANDLVIVLTSANPQAAGIFEVILVSFHQTYL